MSFPCDAWHQRLEDAGRLQYPFNRGQPNNDQIAALRLFAAAEASMEFNDGLDHLVLATQTDFVR
jgi:hypothetical protein